MSVISTILEFFLGSISRIFAYILKWVVCDFIGGAFIYFAETAYNSIITEGGFTDFSGLTKDIQELIAWAHGGTALNTTISAITIIILAVNIVFCGLKIMTAPMTGKESESPQSFFTKIIISVALIFSYKEITRLVVDFLNAFTSNGLFSTTLNLGGEIELFGYERLTDLVFDKGSISTQIIGELVVYAVIYIMLFKDLLFAAVIYIERYLSFAIYLLLGPICFAMYPNENTKNVTQEWLKGILSQIMVMVLSMFLFRIFFIQLALMSHYAGDGAIIGSNELAQGIVLIVLLNILKDSEQLVNMLGLRTIPSGDTARSFVQGFVGMYGTAKAGMGAVKTLGKIPGLAFGTKNYVVGTKKAYDKKHSEWIEPRRNGIDNAKEQTTQFLSDSDGKLGLSGYYHLAETAHRNAKEGGGILNTLKTVHDTKKEYQNNFQNKNLKQENSEEQKLYPLSDENGQIYSYINTETGEITQNEQIKIDDSKDFPKPSSPTGAENEGNAIDSLNPTQTGMPEVGEAESTGVNSQIVLDETGNQNELKSIDNDTPEPNALGDSDGITKKTIQKDPKDVTDDSDDSKVREVAQPTTATNQLETTEKDSSKLQFEANDSNHDNGTGSNKNSSANDKTVETSSQKPNSTNTEFKLGEQIESIEIKEQKPNTNPRTTIEKHETRGNNNNSGTDKTTKKQQKPTDQNHQKEKQTHYSFLPKTTKASKAENKNKNRQK